ncbi:energy transducer TonB [Pseudophaeobacter sp. EL27]|uniref:energy transducer TonB n=1 Tax=Pseudophaeobacter sp. EL27 TaxID=2107580 RepID=UPI000EFBFE7B|nr:energy transducer TonB [Pseudophaeobacter sp. EL27]
MKRTAEVTLFAGLAALIHVSLFASATETGVQSSGAGGEAMVSIEAASATVAEMVKAWERPPPRPQMENPELEQPLAPTEAPQMPEFELADAPRAAVLVALKEPVEADVVEIDQSTPPPPPPPEPEPKPEPKPRPKPAPKPVETPPTAQTSNQTSAGRAEQRAAGSGGGAQAGAAGGASTATISAGQRAKLQSIWGAKIRSRIERRKRYPAGARGSGRVVLRITVAASGALVNYRVAKSSGVAAFDQAALKAVSRAGKFPKAPKGIGASQFTFNLPMSFSK